MIKLSKAVNNENSVWDTTNPNPCSWKGVICSTNNRFITHVSLSKLGLSTSDFLTDLCQIDSLQSLDLSMNSLSSIPNGFISECGKINGLKMLNFSQNKLSGFLPTFNGFSGLESLDLSVNTFGGNIDLQLDGLIRLKNLNLSLNFFNGFVPTHLGKSMVLEELQLSKNRFVGQIPAELFSYQNLTLIDLSSNNISGFVPNYFEKLSKLESLLLSANNISGEIPENLSNIETLARLAANQNKITGTIPRRISQFVKHLDLSYNNLTGSIPTDLLSSPNLQSVDLSYNSLEGPIPTNISVSLFRLRLGSNLLNGSIPAATIGKLVKLMYLELDNNSLSGEIPKELGSCVELALLNLAQNDFTGSMPKELSNLRQLQVMKLQSNRLIGEIPDQFSQLQNLSILNISQNSLTGSIPSGISNLQKLVNFNLQNNKLNGSIPELIGSLNLLIELQLGKNCLSGQIPMMPPKLQIALNLSSNCFEGPIPETLAGLYALEVLDLSNNKFSGKIPLFLTKMRSLTRLLLSNNQLSGNLPQFMAYVLVDTSGNKDLINSTTYNTSPKKRISVTVAILIAVTSVVLVIGITGAIVLIVSRRFYRVNDENLHSEEQLSLPQVINGHLLTTNSIHRSNIDFTTAMKAVSNPTNIILKSRFSTYYKAVMPCGRDYYVKKLNWDDKIFQLGSHERFGKELEVLGRLNNSNVMVPLAYVLTVDSAYLFYEYAQKGTLFDALHGNLGKVLDWTSRYSIAIGIAQGLAFLHGCNSGSVLLLDLSARSIFLKSLKEPQIGDIELFEVIDPSKSTGSLSTVAGSVGYIPPEYAYTMRVTLPGNVYSFGVLLLELLTGKPAVSEGTELAKWVLSNSIHRETWDQILDPNVSKTSNWVRSQMLSVLKVALGCVSVSPEARPKMKNVLNMLLNAK
ncbi:Protein kinase domain [Macleaya cordata]|uniref:Protein kinase domain n=1 Tax=Macleaya cordata TaxID=56857 RepID=A0A200Q433_MACCD|nr:Protein kinase domain [Macleaya cordata]